VVEITKRGGITREHLAAANLREDLRVLLKTPNSAFWNEPAFRQDFTYLDESAASYLVEQGVKVIGIDYLSVEQFKKPGAPAHRALLSRNAIIIEGLNLSDAAPGMYEMYCLPLPVTGGDGAPARVVLKH
jgi:arylformamidase